MIIKKLKFIFIKNGWVSSIKKQLNIIKKARFLYDIIEKTLESF